MTRQRRRRFGSALLFVLALHNAANAHIAFAFSSPSPRASVLCVGETLYDSLPDAIFLGGAPTNVAIHLASLGGVDAAVASCVGDDQLGNEAERRLTSRGVDTRLMQRSPVLSTGMVIATIDGKGDATYQFDTPAAWDALALTEDLRVAVKSADVVIIGTIASRLGLNPDSETDNVPSAATIRSIRNMARENTVVMDVNLRPPWYEASNVLALCRGIENGDESKELAMVKLNDEELPIVESWCGLNSNGDHNTSMSGEGLAIRMEALGLALNSCRVCVTRGENGAALWCRNEGPSPSGSAFPGNVFCENEGYSCSSPEPGSDTVGAGDSFLAALVKSLLLDGECAEQALNRACGLGGFVASCSGAVPEHSKAPPKLRKIFSSQ